MIFYVKSRAVLVLNGKQVRKTHAMQVLHSKPDLDRADHVNQICVFPKRSRSSNGDR